MERFGNFSSSEIWKLTTLAKNGVDFGKPALTYIQEKKFERLLGRSLNQESRSKYTEWGNICEKFVFDLLPLDYQLISKVRYAHQTVPYWNGMPDCIAVDKVCDIKCPFTLLSFVNQIESHKVGTFKKDYPEYYWQLVSNAILTDKKIIESIVFVPYFEQIQEIKKIGFEYYNDDQLPYLVNDINYKNINIFTYDLDINDVDLLTNLVKKANG